MPDSWFLLQSGPGAAAENMAMDEALLEASARLTRPLLRFYGWTEPAATFGYFQQHAQVADWTPLRPLIRRPTGGGLVPHDADWTYTLVFPPSHLWFGFKAAESYRKVHEWIRAAFSALGVRTALAPVREKEGSGQCFAGAEEFDLLCQERKVAGAAQRRNRDGLLIQGSVQPPSGSVRRGDWEKAMRESAPFSERIAWTVLEADEALIRRVRELAATKYSQPAYNERR